MIHIVYALSDRQGTCSKIYEVPELILSLA